MPNESTSIEGSSPPPSPPPPETEGLEEQAQAYLAEQDQSITHAYNSSTITIVVSLLPLDDNPQGRLGVLSVKNDNDAPLFGAPLHEDEVRPLLDALPVAALLQTLKALLPQRLKEREEQAKGKGKEQKPTLQGTGGSGAGSGGASTTRPTPPRTARKSTPQTATPSTPSGYGPPVSPTNNSTPSVTGTTPDPTSQPSIETGKTTQLTLF